MSRTEGDKPLLGLLLMLGFCVMAPLADAIAKILGGSLPLLQLLLVRFAVQAALLMPLVWWARMPLIADAATMRLILLRTVLHVLGIGAMFVALRFLPLADAIAIAFVLPFIQLLLGHFILNEEVGLRRLLACAVGFTGTLMVIQPSFVEVGAPAFLPLLVAVIFSVFILITRLIAKKIDPIALQAVSGLIATPILLAALLVAEALPQASGFVWPDATNGALLLAIGVIGTLSHLLLSWSLKFAPSTTLAPLQYLEIPFATVIGWLIFRDLPNGLASLGIAVTMGAGLYIMLREHAVTRTKQTKTSKT
ncbi:DMT family transporter [Halovulum sp. GXIMD14793]